jgi:hypothetical protein
VGCNLGTHDTGAKNSHFADERFDWGCHVAFRVATVWQRSTKPEMKDGGRQMPATGTI